MPHEQARRPAEQHLEPARMAEQVNYNDPIEPWAEPQAWQEPVRPMVNPSPQPVANLAPPQRELPTGLNGFCPVQLVEGESWVTGDSIWAVEHRGHIYLMSGANQQQRFLANPDRYAPVLSGNDPVVAVDQGQREAGRTDHCVVYDGRLYSFSSHSTLSRFRQNPKRYAAVAKGAAY